ncbi:Rieske (2Fe-2S) protein [Actinoplanes sp. NEAU-A12]|uniref:Rieske (2Fe-2S) protein n=1 Tax=Actinoplanes sandaracinus TaxID=3045177 RepID=A0ABT6WSX3_9ACTN|nr:Rieske (2Fe-2S) protein [Actinoplanes sandaracinus]MDI6102810.1 Rieske (2Fe-2S) protein [Actinoplanes sandaracinus]
MLRQVLTRLEQAHALDGASDRLQAAVSATVRPRPLRDLLHGKWLGHPLHPVLVQVPVGAFISAAVLDLLPSRSGSPSRSRFGSLSGFRSGSAPASSGDRAVTALIAAGLAGVAPAVMAGLVDWSEMTKDRRRVGLVHAAANTVAVGLYAGSLVARLTGRATAGKALAFAGLSVAGTGAFLGGHLSYAQGGGVSHAAPEVARVPEEWTVAGSLSSLPDGKPAARRVGDVAVLLYRQGDQVTALIDRCSHEGGPLSEGDLSDGCVVCPWHGSTFRLSDGAVVHGPAGNDQPVLPVRVRDGLVEVRRP